MTSEVHMDDPLVFSLLLLAGGNSEVRERMGTKLVGQRAAIISWTERRKVCSPVVHSISYGWMKASSFKQIPRQPN